MGKHKRRKTRFLAKNYIFGAASITFLMVCTFCFLIGNFFGGALNAEWLLVCIGIFAASGSVMWLLYYRRGKKSTELWLPKAFTRFIRKKARETNDNVEAFSLGLLSSFAEMPLSLAIYFIVANCILQMHNGFWQIAAVAAYAALTVFPMIYLKLRVKTGRSAVDAQKWRINNKAFSRIFSGSSFMILAVFVLAFWVM